MVEIVQAEAPCDAVEEDGIGDRNWDDIADVQLKEVCVPQDRPVVDVSDEDEDEENDSKEVEKRSDKGAVAAMILRHGRRSEAGV